MATLNGKTNRTCAEIILYTNHGCPWAHRAHIALAELALPYKEEIIDLTTPRSASYLALNPRGLVPTLKQQGLVIPESAIVVQFLVDQYPSHLVKKSSEPGGPLQRARIAFFVDALITKVQSQFFPQVMAETQHEKREKVDGFVDAVVREMEPLLVDAGPFFGGALRLTLAEVLTGSFVLRYLSLPKHGLLHPDLLTELEKRAPRFWKWANAVVAEKSVNYIWDEEKVVATTKQKVAKMAAVAAAK